ncbi:PREDICTED: putative late blight resistance protein homolog R1C-3 [Erythranthe guttata]|uniref:putative late blight resistance protein homolog R1C-3 n=1 Tax=Erythranthe guttata TaxID=4155 RepID=UPI00064DF1BB|nr:PREDICTED: putative late blight resistance protein homolog R1C-3 [Erythranthe guttata]|eukprot:XP_012829201.1 PREDICTED: putative late blight resistance protein homolog R1C-3 [Erythranthe guttata]
MAYGAVGCLELTTERLLKSSHISIVQNSSPQIINLLYDEILSLKEALREFNTRRSTINMKMVKTLEAQIIDVVYEFEDVFDSHLANQLYSQSEEETGDPPLMLFSVDLQEIKQDVDSFVERMNKMKKAYIHELCNPSPEEDDCVGPSSRIDFGGNDDYNMVGLSDIFTEIKDLSRPKYRLADILVDILTQLNNLDIDEVILLMKGAELLVELKRMVFKSLRFLRYLIVPDDLWDVELYFDLTEFFPDDNNGSRVLLTTRTEEVGYCASMWRDYNLRFLDKKESWELLRHKVFGEEEPCSYELEKAGKKIAENCEGLPLTIITIANILSKADKTIEYWNEVADDKRNSVYKDAYEQMSKVLYPSYDYLEQHLKAFFLYLGAFPKNYSVYGYQMVNLCGAEGFLNPDPIATFENNSYGYLNELCFKNVIMSAKEERGFHLHSSFWYLCNKEAPKNNFYYALNFCADALQEEVYR